MKEILYIRHIMSIRFYKMSNNTLIFKHPIEDCPSYDGLITSIENFYIPSNATAPNNITSSIVSLDGLRFCSYKPEINGWYIRVYLALY